MADFFDTLGLETLPASTSGAGAMDAAQGTGAGGGLDVPLAPPGASTAAGSGPATGGLDLNQILGMLRPQQPQGVLSPNSQFMAALGAGLSSAGQNWNKPALAAFASGAGAALQGGQQWSNQQQDARLKALQAAIAAWKTGDLAAYRQAIVDLRVATTPVRPLAPSAPPSAPTAPVSPMPGSGVGTSPGTTGSPTGPTIYGTPAPPAANAMTPSRSAAPVTAEAGFAQARDAIARGAPREAVIKRLHQLGIDPSGL